MRSVDDIDEVDVNEVEVSVDSLGRPVKGNSLSKKWEYRRSEVIRMKKGAIPSRTVTKDDGSVRYVRVTDYDVTAPSFKKGASKKVRAYVRDVRDDDETLLKGCEYKKLCNKYSKEKDKVKGNKTVKLSMAETV